MTDTSSIVKRAFACHSQGRYPLFPVLTDNHFNEKDFGEIVKKHNDSKPFASFAAARTEAEAMDAEYEILFDTQTKFEPLAWYNIFHEVFYGKRYRVEADDMPNRQKHTLPEHEVQMYQQYAIALCQTPPTLYTGCYNERQQQMKETFVTSPWIAANALLGSKWLKQKGTTEDTAKDRPTASTTPPKESPPANTDKEPPATNTNKDPQGTKQAPPPTATDAVGLPIPLFSVVKRGGKTYYGTDFVTPFKKEFYLAEYDKAHSDIKGLTLFEEMKDEATKYNEFMAGLFKTKKEFKAFDWYNLFHEAFHGRRLRTDRDDVPDRGTFNPVARTDFTDWGYALCQTSPKLFGNCLSKDETIEANFFTVQWLGAVALLGNTCKEDPTKEMPPPATEKPPVEGQPSAPAPEKTPAEGQQPPTSAPAPAPEQTEEEKQAHLNRLAIIRQSILRGFLARLKVQHMRRERALNAVTTDIYIKAKADRLLASFETDTEFMKCMNAVEILALVLKKDPLELVVPWSQEVREQWNWKEECPKISDLSRAHTEMLRELWESRGNVSCLLDPVLIEAARSAHRCSYKHFLVLLNRGRQIYSDFSFLNPRMPPQTVKNLVFITLQNTVKGPELQQAWDSYKAKAVQAKRTAESYQKKKAAEEQAKSKEEEAKKLAAEKSRLEEELKRIQAEQKATAKDNAGTKQSAAAATMALRNRGLLRKKTAEESKITAELKKVEKKEKKALQKKRTMEAEAEDADKASKEAQEAAAELNKPAAEPPKKKAKKQAISLLNLTGDDSEAPTRLAGPKNKTVYNAPGIQWHQLACHQHTLWDHCRGIVKEACLSGELYVDWGAIRNADNEALVKKNKEDAVAAFKKVEKLKEQGQFTADEMLNIMQQCGDHEEIYITSFVKKAIIRLGMIDLSEFTKDGMVDNAKIKLHHICNSLKAWLIEGTERKQFYLILRAVEQLHQSKQLSALKKLVNVKFATNERMEMVAMLQAVTKRPKK